MELYYAHSGKTETGINCQLYKNHIDKEIGRRLKEQKKDEFVSYQDITKNSVQKWSNFIEKLENPDIIEHIERTRLSLERSI
jgi:hypothetical protein